MNRLKVFLLFVLVVIAAFWWITRPAEGLGAAELAAYKGDIERGETIFHIGGCASCHSQSESEGEADRAVVLSGGNRFVTEFGTFISPNISPHLVKGIGSWSTEVFANAMLYGVSPAGEHYYPAFPYTSYTRMSLQDVVDLKAYMGTLPLSDRDNETHLLTFPFSIRRGLGAWKWLFLDSEPVIRFDKPDRELLRGQYLVEGPGHCAECHTPRNLVGGFISGRWLAGAPNPDGDGRIPNITPHETGLGKWETVDIVEYLSSGFTPDYDVAGSSMAEVVENTAHLSNEDRTAIARYLQSVPEHEKTR